MLVDVDFWGGDCGINSPEKTVHSCVKKGERSKRAQVKITEIIKFSSHAVIKTTGTNTELSGNVGTVSNSLHRYCNLHLL